MSFVNITIDLTESVPAQGPAEEWIEKLEFIPLETNADCFLSSRIRFDMDDKHIADKHIAVISNETVHLFTRDGNQLISFTKQGKGPGEYVP